MSNQVSPESADRAELIALFRRVLQLEQRRGYTNAAVRGGLNLFLENWARRWPASGQVGAERLIASFADYSVAGPGVRKQVVDLALQTTLAPDFEVQAGLAPGLAPALPASAPPSVWRNASSSVVAQVEKPAAVEAASRPSAKNGPVPRPSGSPSTERPPRPRSASAINDLDASVESLRGVGPSNAERFAKLGVATVRDLLYHFPRRHLDYRTARLIRDLTFEEYETILATVWRVKVESRPGGLVIIRAIIGDESGTAEAVWIRRKDYISKELPTNRQVVLSGECRLAAGRPVFRDPDWEAFSGEDTVHTARLVPVYPLVDGINGRFLRRITKQAVDRYATLLVDFLPTQLRAERSLLDLSSAIAQAHYPDSDELKRAAQRRLAFDELLVIQLGFLARRHARSGGDPAHALADGGTEVEAFIASLPFGLTGAQVRALAEVRRQLALTVPMSVLLEGDVGSGKTVVAAAAAVQAAASGFQTAIMAPTEILAEQHFQTFERLLGGLGAGAPKVCLLTGSVKGAERRRLYAAIRDGDVGIIAGTQALVQERLEFGRLGLVVVDEQHRFGVIQRDTLRQKGFNPHVLAMTATPIPRTLALTMYGDLDVARLDELPPGRQIIKTRHLQPSDRPRAYEFVRREVALGHQAFVVCPLVEESSKNSEARAATAEFDRLRTDVFPDLRLGLLHGRMKPAEKDTVMRQFQNHEFDIMVSTSVIEVGIDVPNATVMVIEGANRFGLAQLHQFRGRVGRGSDQSFCLLISDTPSLASNERLTIVEGTHDGFVLADEDLRLRGPGEFLGTRQSGLPDLKMAQLSDVANVEDARDAAIQLYRADPALAFPEHRLLRVHVEEFWARAAVAS